MLLPLVIGALGCAAPAHAAEWVPTGPAQPRDIVSVSGFPGGAAYAAAATGRVLASTDAGLTWQQRTSPPGETSMSMRMATSTIGWATRAGRLSRTSDGAATWSVVAFPPEQADPAHGYDTVTGVGTGNGGRTVSMLVDGTARDGHCLVPDHQSALNTSHDGGETWRRATLPFDATGTPSPGATPRMASPRSSPCDSRGRARPTATRWGPT
jgi:photosystem II stability/assembly factor-like uncharacterized protein